MRELKFRVWSKKLKQYSPVGLGSADGTLKIRTSLKEDSDAPDDYIIEQFTGLNDKNGKDIYEGDIISFENEKGLARVLWLDGKAMFGLKWLDCGVEDELDYWIVCRGPAEVIGNIHEYPELLEKKNGDKN